MDEVKYKLVDFIKESHERKKMIDIVPSSWIFFDFEEEILKTKFLPPPYDEENTALVHSLVKCVAPAPHSWPSYAIAIRGEAKTYEEASKKLKKLNTKKFVFSTDDEISCIKKAAIASDKYKKKNLWQVPDIIVDENENLNSQKKGKYINPATQGNVTDKVKSNEMNVPTVLFNEMIPVLEANASPEDIADLKRFLTKHFHTQSLHLTKISTQLEEIKNMMSGCNVGQISNINDFSFPVRKHDLVLPLQNLDDFKAFDDRLLSDKPFRDDVVASIWQIASIKATVQQTVRDILKKFVSREVVLQCTVVKDTGKKLVLKTTQFFLCMQDVVVAKCASNGPPITLKDFEQALRRVVNNAKDWEGNRNMRKKNESQ